MFYDDNYQKAQEKNLPFKSTVDMHRIVVMILVMLIKSLDFYFMKEFLKLLKILLWVFLLLETQEVQVEDN